MRALQKRKTYHYKRTIDISSDENKEVLSEIVNISEPSRRKQLCMLLMASKNVLQWPQGYKKLIEHDQKIRIGS